MSMNAHSSPRRRRLVGAAALATVGVLAALSVPTSSALAAEGDTTIDLYNVNDFHGRIARSVSTPRATATPVVPPCWPAR